MEERIARGISIVFHPLFIPTYFMATLMSLNVFFSLMIPFESKWRILLLVLLTSAIFPMLILYSMYRFKLIKSLNMESREERIYPYAATSIFFFLTTNMIYQINISPVYYYVMMAASILAVLTLLINIYWKISAHTVSMGGMLGILIALQSVLLIDILWLIAVTLLLAGLVGFARLRAGTHTQAQVYAGYILGYLVSFLLVLYF
jgi:membrane-associated phospholipid phosphatase